MEENTMTGKEVKRMFIGSFDAQYDDRCGSGESIKFVFNDGTDGYFITDADCCSETWFADIIGVKALLSGRITKEPEFKELETQDQDKRCRQEHDEFYSVEVTTNKGVCVFAFRNSSNGYYGGTCSYSGKNKFTDFETNDFVWREITEDYSA